MNIVKSMNIFEIFTLDQFVDFISAGVFTEVVDIFGGIS